MKHDTEYICVCETWEEPALYPIAELIRCRNCKAYNGMKCVRNNMIAVRADDFCSRAEKIED